MRDWFAAPDAEERVRAFTLEAAGLTLDYSKNRITPDTLALLLKLADEAGVLTLRDAMLRGECINNTEHRSVLHVALRGRAKDDYRADGVPVMPDVLRVRAQMRDFANRVHSGAWTGHSGQRITDVVNIGIGGSDLGPRMAVAALEPLARRGPRLHFVSNVDGHDIDAVLRGLDARRTLFIVASKTFTTQETMANAHAARDWFDAQGGTDRAAHFVGVTTNLQAAAAFGITRTFGFWDWVGGRYSLWSAIGLPLAIAIGSANFRAFLDGAHAMDRHFATAPLAHNLPALLGLLDVWYRNFHGFASRSVAPYHQGLHRLPAYLQQLEMESNGKGVDLDGAPLPYGTSPVVWGEPGTNGQHAYFQMLHQGTDVIPVEFILVRQPAHALRDQHAKLLANGLAQAQALMLGKTTNQALAEQAPTASATLDRAVLARHRTFPGNRPSTTLLLEALTPRSLGALIAMYEHRVFVSGALWGINSFDQWGVELGKALCNALLPRLDSGDVTGLDGSTAGLLKRLVG
jgi:glucose-6-phosphate isomerase